jgi:anti-anti-sigma regulatory factor
MFDYPLTLPNAEKLKKDLISVANKRDSFVVELEEFERINMACLQLLAAFKRDADNKNKSCNIYISPNVYSMVSTMGMEEYFSLKGES